METKLYVGNLAYAITDNDLRTAFEQAGEVKSSSVIMDRETHRSKGFGFVEMGTSEQANKAIEMLNGAKLGERAISVSIARPREERPRNFGGGGGGGFGGGDRGGFRGERGPRRW